MTKEAVTIKHDFGQVCVQLTVLSLLYIISSLSYPARVIIFYTNIYFLYNFIRRNGIIADAGHRQSSRH